MSTNSNRFSHLKEALIIIIGFTIVILFLYNIDIRSLSFKQITESDLLAIIASLFVVSIFMERTVETILTPVRAPDRKIIEHDIDDLIKEVEELKKNAQQFDIQNKSLHDKQHQLDMYNITTARRSYWLSFGFGLIISLIGVRALNGLIIPAELTNLSKLQVTLFRLVDVVLTGGVIAGGSAAIDKIGRAISEQLKFK